MDFSQVKSLTIPEGDVTKITDSSGRVLWKKRPAHVASWHTVFNKDWDKAIRSSTALGYTSICALDACEAPFKLRITGSFWTNFFSPRSITFTWIGESSENITQTDFSINKETAEINQIVPPSSAITVLDAVCKGNDLSSTVRFAFEVTNDGYLKLNIKENNNGYSGFYITLGIHTVEQYY